ncbi:MAG: alpha/beta fold hydrolase [Alphaproteobacteria bacterium]|nr:alpha/beta fold hydrolase [Alphaproteobacteria bacterium]
MGRVIDMPLPRLGETMEEGRIGLIIKKPGERFRRGETLLEVESDKTTVEVPALQDGVLVEWLVSSDQMVPVESAIARIEIEGEAVAEARSPAPAIAKANAPIAPQSRRTLSVVPERPRASTAARAAARRSGIDLSGVTGSGRNGRITRDDLATLTRPAKASYHVASGGSQIFFREWPAHGRVRGLALLIHGLFADSQSFTTLGRKLAGRGLRVLAVDLPGHGETQSPAVTPDQMIDTISAALPAGKMHIIGHSFGAIVAAGLADRASSLTMLAPAGCGEIINGTFIDAMLAGHVDQGLAFLGETMPADAVARFADHLSVHAGHLKAISACVRSESAQTVSILGKLESLPRPVTAVFQRDDAIIPAEHALNMPANVAVHFLKGASHLPHWRNPDVVAGLVFAD